MGFTYEDVTPSIIPNTTMQKRLLDGVHRSYVITPVESYVLHSKGRDFIEVDPDTMEELGIKLGFAHNPVSCGADYDFTPCTVTDRNGSTYTGYGESEYFAVLASSVPADQIFGVTTDHEAM